MQDVNLLQGLVRLVGDCRAVHDDHRVGRVKRCSQLRVDHCPGPRPQSNGEVGFAVVQPRQMLLEPARAAALEDHHVIWQYPALSHCRLQFASLQV